MKSLSIHTLRCVRGSSVLWAILAALSLGPLPAHSAQPQSVKGTDVYLWIDTGQGLPNPAGRVRTHVQSIAIIHFDTPLLQGRLEWEGELKMDSDGNGALAVKGVIELGTWDFTKTDDAGLPLFVPSPTGGKWRTSAEVHGNFNIPEFNTGFVGICVAHGISGPVEGMVAVLPFTGGPGVIDLGVGDPFLTIVDCFEDGQIVNPHAAK